MKFLIFNIVTGGALVYLVLAGSPPGPVTPPIPSVARIEPEPDSLPNPVPEPERVDMTAPAPMPAPEEDVPIEARSAMMSPSERARMLRDLARDMDAKFLQSN